MSKKSSGSDSDFESEETRPIPQSRTPNVTPDPTTDPSVASQAPSDPVLTRVFQRTQSESEPIGSVAVAGSPVAGPSPSDAAAATATAEANKEDSGAKDGKKKKNRCHTCKKKVGLTGKDDPSLLTPFSSRVSSRGLHSDCRHHSILFSSSILPDYVATSRYYF